MLVDMRFMPRLVEGERGSTEDGLVLGLHVVEEGAPGDLGVAADVLDGDVVEAVLLDERGRRILDPAAGGQSFAFAQGGGVVHAVESYTGWTFALKCRSVLR